ncbi:hypothetical protein BD560DRAFT_494411 [Blakeslea trispora]|nr:hypothetical protein BD560DRAFT_494411 [Blakeslea trispora]
MILVTLISRSPCCSSSESGSQARQECKSWYVTYISDFVTLKAVILSTWFTSSGYSFVSNAILLIFEITLQSGQKWSFGIFCLCSGPSGLMLTSATTRLLLSGKTRYSRLGLSSIGFLAFWVSGFLVFWFLALVLFGDLVLYCAVNRLEIASLTTPNNLIDITPAIKRHILDDFKPFFFFIVAIIDIASIVAIIVIAAIISISATISIIVIIDVIATIPLGNAQDLKCK